MCTIQVKYLTNASQLLVCSIIYEEHSFVATGWILKSSVSICNWNWWIFKSVKVCKWFRETEFRNEPEHVLFWNVDIDCCRAWYRKRCSKLEQLEYAPEQPIDWTVRWVLFADSEWWMILRSLKMLLTGYITGDMYSRQQSGPGGPATPSAPPNMSSSNANSKPGSDYSNYASYGSYSTDGGYGAPPRSYGSDAGSQVGGYSSQPPNAGAKHFNDFKEWPSSWQPFDNICANNVAPAQFPFDSYASKNIRVYFNGVKAISAYYPDVGGFSKHQLNGDLEEEGGWMSDGTAGTTLRHISNLNNMGMCYNSWKRVGLINVKRAAGLVTPAKFNYSD